MIEHIVLFKWKEAATAEDIEKALRGLRGMKGRIAGVIDLSCGENFSARAQGFTHGLVVRLTDRAALESYATDPVHVEVLTNAIRPLLQEALALDYAF